MSDPMNIRSSSPKPRDLHLSVSPSVGRNFQIPSPIITKRTRTYSTSERAASNPIETGKVKSFCRNKGHGFIKPDSGGQELFLHISDIEGEYVPREGDEVSYRLCPIPPKNDRVQAVHVHILNLCPETHERWDSPCPSPSQSPSSPRVN
jgi:cold shock CspA family protein